MFSSKLARSLSSSHCSYHTRYSNIVGVCSYLLA